MLARRTDARRFWPRRPGRTRAAPPQWLPLLELAPQRLSCAGGFVSLRERDCKTGLSRNFLPYVRFYKKASTIVLLSWMKSSPAHSRRHRTKGGETTRCDGTRRLRCASPRAVRHSSGHVQRRFPPPHRRRETRHRPLASSPTAPPARDRPPCQPWCMSLAMAAATY
jgi:hypothetical protein